MTDRAMPRGVARVLLVCLCLALISTSVAVMGVGPANAAVDTRYYFTGQPGDQAAKLSVIAGEEPTATFQKQAPTGSTPITQDARSGCPEDTIYNIHCAYWVGSYAGGAINGNVEFCWYWSSTNATVVAAGSTTVLVSIFADYNHLVGAQPEKVIGRGTMTVKVGTPAAPAVSSGTIPVKGNVNTDLYISVRGHPANAPETAEGLMIHYGAPTQASAFGPPGQACHVQPSGAPTSGSPTANTSSPTPSTTPTATPTTPTPGPTPSPTPTGGKLPSPGARIKFSDPTPAKGEATVATAWLKTCNGHQKTKIQLQRKQGSKFKRIAQKKMSNTCRATFEIRAKFDKATFRSFWPKQDADHRAGKSRPKTVRTH